MKKWIIRALIGGMNVGGAVALSAVNAGCHKDTAAGAQPASHPPPIVNVATATASDVREAYLDEIGKANAVESVTVMPQVAGRLDALHFADGADLKARQLLFTLDGRPFLAAQHQAEAQLLKDQAASINADRFLNRQADIYKQGFVSPSDYDTALFNSKAAKAALEVDQAAIDSAKLNVEYCTIKSPFDGRAGMRLVDPGNVVRRSTRLPVARHSAASIQSYADFTINEGNLTDVRAHMNDHTLVTQVKLPTDHGTGVVGDLTFLDNAVQDASGTIKVRATLPNKDRHFWPGQYVNVRLVLQVKSDVLIPQSAPQLAQQGPFVYVVKADSTAESRQVVLGQQQPNNMVVVLSGVKAGESRDYQWPVARLPGRTRQRTAGGRDAPTHAGRCHSKKSRSGTTAASPDVTHRPPTPTSTVYSALARRKVVNLSEPIIRRPVISAAPDRHDHSVWRDRLHEAAGERSADGGLSGHPGDGRLSRRQPADDGGQYRHAARAGVHADSRAGNPGDDAPKAARACRALFCTILALDKSRS